MLLCSSVLLAAGQALAQDAFEPDDSPEEATPLLAGEPQTHSIVPQGDNDWLTFELTAESGIVLETSGPAGDTRMWLYDEALVTIEADDDSGVDLFSRIDRSCGAEALPAGVYFVKIDQWFNQAEIPSYDISLSVTTCDPYEPDNSPEEATPLLAGEPQTHSILPVGDEDWLTFELTALAAIVLETSGPAGDTRMWLYDEALVVVDYDDNGGSGLFSRIERGCGADVLSPGIYFVQIDEVDSDQEIPSYTISLGVSESCDNFEPDNSPDQAVPLLPGEPQMRAISPVGDEDWVTFELTAESAVVLETSGPAGDTRMWLYDEALVEIDYDDNGGAGSFSRIERSCDFDALQPGVYFVQIDENLGDEPIPSYTISLSITSCEGRTVGWVILGDPESTLGDAAILAAGHVPVALGTIEGAELASLDALWILNPSNSSYAADLTSNVELIRSFVEDGGTLLFHDRYVTEAASVLPGGNEISFIHDSNNEIDVLLRCTTVTGGPGGAIDDETLDDGYFSNHGYADAATLPQGTTMILGRSDPSQVVDFSYELESGYVYYSTVPIDAHLRLRSPFDDIYAPNVVDHAVHIPAVLLYFSQDSSGDGLHCLNPRTGLSTHLGASGVTGAGVGLAPGDDLDALFGSKPETLLRISTDGSGALDLGGESAEGLAYDAARRRLYGASAGQFFALDPTDGSKLAGLAAPGTDIQGIAVGHGGVYALSGQSSHLFFYSPGGDSWSVVGDTGVDWGSAGLAFDPIRDVLYAKGNQDSLLYAIDPATAATGTIGDTGIGSGGGLAVRSVIPVPEPSLTSLRLACVAGLALIAGWRRRAGSHGESRG